MKLLVGLGNPGRKYQDTRHNIGFDVAARVTSLLGGPAAKSRFGGQFAEAVYQGEKVLVLCPETYMNASGSSVRQAVDFYKLDLQDDQLLVVCDDMNLPAGQLRFRPGGSAGGQKGLADIINQLGTDQFSRLRIGIDRPPPQMEVVDFVLSKFSAQQRDTMSRAVELAAGAALQWVVSDVKTCMNQYNAREPKTPQTKPRRPESAQRAATTPDREPKTE
jgi:peptidyl-tRNA hydrolase, PTH1 family